MNAQSHPNPLEIPVKHLLRIDEAAKVLRCSENSVRRYIREGKLARQRRGMITRASLMRFLGLFDNPVEPGFKPVSTFNKKGEMRND